LRALSQPVVREREVFGVSPIKRYREGSVFGVGSGEREGHTRDWLKKQRKGRVGRVRRKCQVEEKKEDGERNLTAQRRGAWVGG
jgi:hypothetical protein